MNEKGEKYLKWGIVAAITVAAGLFVAPLVATAAWNLTKAAAAVVGLGAFVLAVPTISEYFAHGLYKAKSFLWKSDPVAKLWRDFNDFLQEIDTVQENINLVATEEENAKAELRKNKPNFDTAEVLEYEEQIGQITEAKIFLMEERDRLKSDAVQMEKDIRKNEAHWKMGNSLIRASKAVDKATGIATGTHGGKIAMDTIQERLAEGRARINVLRSQRSAEGIREQMKARKATVIDAQATEVKPAPALTNTPSPVLPARVSLTETAKVKTPASTADLLSKL